MSDKRIMPLEEAHILLLYILKQINRITEKEGIPYFAHGGTTLGAIRHNGFIPWDDDIDLIMERKYYDSFVKACEKYLPDELVIRTRENDPFFCEEYIKVCFKDDVCKFSELDVDIFFLDETDPKRTMFRMFQNAIIRAVRPIKLYKASRKAEYMEKYVPHNKIKHLLLAVLSVLPLSVLTNIQTKAMLAEKKQTEWYVDWGSVVSYKRATWEKRLYSGRVKKKFENMYVYVSDHFEELLKRGYGESYMQLPPVEKRKTHNVHIINNERISVDQIQKVILEEE